MHLNSRDWLSEWNYIVNLPIHFNLIKYSRPLIYQCHTESTPTKHKMVRFENDIRSFRKRTNIRLWFASFSRKMNKVREFRIRLCNVVIHMCSQIHFTPMQTYTNYLISFKMLKITFVLECVKQVQFIYMQY